MKVTVLLITAMTVSAYAQDGRVLATPTTRPVVDQVIADHETAMKAARHIYYGAVLEADRLEISRLVDATNNAMTNHLLDDANLVAEKRRGAERVLNQHTSESLSEGGLDELAIPVTKIERPTTELIKAFDIAARDKWQTTIRVRKGQHYRITATGKWSHSQAQPDSLVGPDGILGGDSNGLHNGRVYYLEGRTNGGLPFGIGSSFELTPTVDGPLEMEMLDNVYDDNSGALRVTIETSLQFGTAKPSENASGDESKLKGTSSSKVFLPAAP